MNTKVVVILLVTLSIILAACSGAGAEDEPVEPSAVQLDAVTAAQEALAAELGVDMEDIQLVKVQDEEWSDSCLGLGGPAESCLAAVTPGYSVVFRYDDKEYTYRTDLAGVEVRQETIEE